MPYIGEDFLPCSPGESDVLRQMDLAAFLNPLEQLVSATWACIALPDYTPDPDAADKVETAGLVQNISPNQLIQATYTTMGDFVAGARYELRARVVTNQGGHYEYWSYLSCLPDNGG